MHYDVYRARGNDILELTKLANLHGYKNPGPIVRFPPNQKVFAANVSPGALRPGTQILVPWHPDLLRKLLVTQEHLAAEVAKEARELIEGAHESKEKLENFLLLIDAVCMLANMGKGIGLVINEAKSGEMTAAQMIRWLAESHLEMARDIATLAVPAPSEPKRDFRFFVRHTLGPWTPSYWAAVYVACKTGDVETYLYGPAAIEYHTKLKIKQQADADISRLRMKIQETRQQLSMPFYLARV